MKKWWLGLLVGVILCSSGVICTLIRVETTFRNQTELLGLDMSNKSLSEAQSLLAELAKDGVIEIHISSEQVIRFSYANFFQDVLNDYLTQLLRQDKRQEPVAVYLAKALKQELVLNLGEQLSIEDFKVEQLKQAQGIQISGTIPVISESTLQEAISSALKGHQVVLPLKQLLTRQSIVNDQVLSKQIEHQLVELAQLDYQVHVADEVFEVRGEDVWAWISFNHLGQVEGQAERIKSALQTYLAQCQPVSLNCSFTTTQGEQRQISGLREASYYWHTDAAAKQLCHAISQKKSLSVVLQPNPIELKDNYLEVDLKHQMLYCYRHGKLCLASPIVSGKAQTPTCPGLYFINQIKSDYCLIGIRPDSQLTYQQPVHHWLSWGQGDQGIHDASWQTAFGGTIYQSQGSLGCINMPLKLMGDLYELVYIDCPVIIF